MKYFFTLFILFVGISAFCDTYVNGYYRKNGTYVQPHYRSSPDSTPFNNYSTKGNTNPYTGKPGTVNPCKKNPYASGCSGSSSSDSDDSDE